MGARNFCARGTPEVMMRSQEMLPAQRSEEGAVDVRALARALGHRQPPVREVAIAALVALGPNGVEPACRLLKSWNSRISLAAAEALGRIGDARAIPPLKQALEIVMGGTGLRRFGPERVTVSRAVVQVLLIQSINWVLTAGGRSTQIWSVLLFSLVWMVVWDLITLRHRRRHGAKIVEALARIEACSPSPQTAELAREFSAIAANRVMQPARTRQAAQAAARWLQAAPGAFSGLPVPASPPELAAAALPIPAEPKT